MSSGLGINKNNNLNRISKPDSGTIKFNSKGSGSQAKARKSGEQRGSAKKLIVSSDDKNKLIKEEKMIELRSISSIKREQPANIAVK